MPTIGRIEEEQALLEDELRVDTCMKLGGDEEDIITNTNIHSSYSSYSSIDTCDCECKPTGTSSTAGGAGRGDTSPLSPRKKTPEGDNVSSLDFERIVNQYSIQAERDRWLLPPLPSDGSTSSFRRRHLKDIDLINQNNKDLQDQDVYSSRPPSKSDLRAGTGTTTAGTRMHMHTPRRKPQKRHIFGISGKKATRWVLTAVAGVLTGLASSLIVQLSGVVVRWRTQQLHSLIDSPRYSDTATLCIFLSLNLVEALLACWLCVGWVPTATGSGIAAVKAYLNGIRGHQKFTRLDLFVVKVVGTILSVSSGLAVGQEGPLIHIGAIMGSACSKVSGIASRNLQKWQQVTSCCRKSRGVCSTGRPDVCHSCVRCERRGPSLAQRVLKWTATELNQFATDGERRDLVSIGASCGFAASFGAPVGGLLFILDDISSYFSKSLILRILVANALGTFCLAVQHHDLSNYSVINLGTYTENSDLNIFTNRIEELPLYILVGVMGGALGGVFCKSFMFFRRNITGRFPKRGQGRAKWQLLEVALVSILTSLLMFYVPSHSWACKAIPQTHVMENSQGLNDVYETGSGQERFFCGAGEVNELASILFGSRIDAIKRILTDPSSFKPVTLLTVGTLFYVLMTLTFGVAIPCGIFTPTVLIGASLGGAAGCLFQEVINASITPSTFALLGVAALLAGIQRSTVSVSVILVEGTGQINILMPAILITVVARYVASLIHKKGIFETVMEWKNLPYLDHEENKRRYDAIEVGDILSDCPVESIGPVEKASKLVAMLDSSSHHGFPVIDPQTKRYLGLVRRDQIAALLECGAFDRSTGSTTVASTWARPRSGIDKTPLMRWAYHINDDRYEYIHQSLGAGDLEPPPEVEKAPRFSMISSRRLQIAAFSALPTEFAAIGKNEDGRVYVSWFNSEYDHHNVNIGAVMNRGAFVVTEFCPVSKAYEMFTALGLRHIIVLGGNDTGGEVVGILSRDNLLPQYILEKTGL